jgi:hypothetical protein
VIETRISGRFARALTVWFLGFGAGTWQGEMKLFDVANKGFQIVEHGKNKHAAFPSPITYCGGSHVRTSKLGSEILPLWFGSSSI